MTATALRLEDVSRRFGGVTALDSLDLTVAEGERVAVVGPNGAGKTTLFDLISGVQKPTQGRIFVHGTDVTRLPTHRIARAGVARTFQHTLLFGQLSVWDCLRLVVQRHMGLAWKAWQPADARVEVNRAVADVLARLRLSEVATEPVAQLSHGVQRQVEIAMGVAANPRILLLDEPTAGMSPVETADMTTLLCGLGDEHLTVVLIEHDIATVEAVATRAVVLHLGSIVADGQPRSIHADPHVRQVLFAARAGHG